MLRYVRQLRDEHFLEAGGAWFSLGWWLMRDQPRLVGAGSWMWWFQLDIAISRGRHVEYFFTYLSTAPAWVLWISPASLTSVIWLQRRSLKGMKGQILSYVIYVASLVLIHVYNNVCWVVFSNELVGRGVFAVTTFPISLAVILFLRGSEMSSSSTWDHVPVTVFHQTHLGCPPLSQRLLSERCFSGVSLLNRKPDACKPHFWVDQVFQTRPARSARFHRLQSPIWCMVIHYNRILGILYSVS